MVEKKRKRVPGLLLLFLVLLMNKICFFLL